MPRDPREAKLPKWTQELIADLRRDLVLLKEDFEEFADETTPEDADAVANPFDEHPRLAARRGETVRFALRRGQHLDARVDHYDGSVELLASRTLSVRPKSGNVVVLSVDAD